MERVTGIGGPFFRARDPAALEQWYQTHLGVPPTPKAYDQCDPEGNPIEPWEPAD